MKYNPFKYNPESPYEEDKNFKFKNDDFDVYLNHDAQEVRVTKVTMSDSTFTIFRRLLHLQNTGCLGESNRLGFGIMEMLERDKNQFISKQELHKYLPFLKDREILNTSIDIYTTRLFEVNQKKSKFSYGIKLRAQLGYLSLKFPLIPKENSLLDLEKKIASSDQMLPQQLPLLSLKYFGDDKGFGFIANYDLSTMNGVLFLPIFGYASSKFPPKDINNPIIEIKKDKKCFRLLSLRPTNEGPIGFINGLTSCQDRSVANCEWYQVTDRFINETKSNLYKNQKYGDLVFTVMGEMELFKKVFEINRNNFKSSLIGIKTKKTIKKEKEIICNYGFNVDS